MGTPGAQSPTDKGAPPLNGLTMIPKKYRVPIQSLPRSAEAVRRGRYFLIKQYPAQEAFSRLGVAVPNRSLPSVAKRHRLSRAVYDRAYPLLAGVRRGDYLVVYAGGDYKPADLDAMINELITLFTP